MAIDPIIVTPNADTGGPYAGIGARMLRPRSFNCLSGAIPAIPPFTPNEYQAQRIVTQSIVAQSMQSGAVLHFGDSLTECMDVSSVSPFSVNFGIGGDTAEAILYRLPSYVVPLRSARAISLMVGINNLRGGGEVAATKEMISRLVSWFSGPLVWTKIVYTSPPQAAVNSNIAEVNAHVTGVLSARPQTAIVDLNPVVAPSGTLLAGYHSGDGLHINSAAYKEWYPRLQAALATL